MAGVRIDLSKQVAIVTGASRGIGEALAKGLASCGANVTIFDLPDARADAERVVAAIAEAGGSAQFLEGDVREPGSISDDVADVVRQLGKLDIFVNNAGVVTGTTALDTTPQEWDQILDVNLRGVFFGCQAVAREMVKTGGGTIINTASQLAFVVPRKDASVAYMANKAGVVKLTKSLAVEWAEYHIRVNALAPGPTKTGMTMSATTTDEELKKRFDIPIGRMMETQDMVGAVMYLASDLSSMVTGHTIVVDGGHSLI